MDQLCKQFNFRYRVTKYDEVIAADLVNILKFINENYWTTHVGPWVVYIGDENLD